MFDPEFSLVMFIGRNVVVSNYAFNFRSVCKTQTQLDPLQRQYLFLFIGILCVCVCVCKKLDKAIIHARIAYNAIIHVQLGRKHYNNADTMYSHKSTVLKYRVLNSFWILFYDIISL